MRQFWLQFRLVHLQRPFSANDVLHTNSKTPRRHSSTQTLNKLSPLNRKLDRSRCQQHRTAHAHYAFLSPSLFERQSRRHQEKSGCSGDECLHRHRSRDSDGAEGSKEREFDNLRNAVPSGSVGICLCWIQCCYEWDMSHGHLCSKGPFDVRCHPGNVGCHQSLRSRCRKSSELRTVNGI